MPRGHQPRRDASPPNTCCPQRPSARSNRPRPCAAHAAQLDRLAAFRLDTWIVDCLREDPTPAHASFDQALAWIARVRPRRAFLTHMNAQLDYRATLARCPAGVEPGYDGLVLEITD